MTLYQRTAAVQGRMHAQLLIAAEYNRCAAVLGHCSYTQENFHFI